MPASPTATYPGALDNPQAPSQFDSLATDGVEHDYVHDWAIDAIKKIEAKLGITSSPDVTSVDYVLKNHQHLGTDRSAQIARLPIKMVASQSLAPLDISTSLGVSVFSVDTTGAVSADSLSLNTPLAIASGGTGSATKNFVDLTTNQSVAGSKTFSSTTSFSGLVKGTGTGSMLDITAAGSTAAGTGNATGDKIQLNSTTYGFGVQTATIVAYVPATSGFAVRPVAGSGQKSSGTDAVRLNADGSIVAGSLSLTTPLPIASGGTGSATQNFVDLTTAQSIAGNKTFNANVLFGSSGTLVSATTGRGLFITNSATQAPLTAKAAASQSANIQEWQSSAAAVLMSIGPTGSMLSTGTAGSSLAYRANVTADTFDRWTAQSDGTQNWGPGNAATDVSLARSSTSRLSLVGSLQISGNPVASNASLVVQAGVGQTGSPLVVRDSGSVNLFGVGTDGALNLYSAPSITANSAAVTALSYDTPTGTMKITAGRASFGQTSTASQMLSAVTDADATIGVIIKRGASTQTADLFRIVDEGNSSFVKVTAKGSLAVGFGGTLANTATDGFLYIPRVIGAPTGVPTVQNNTVPIQYDTTNNRLYAYNGGWKSVVLA